MPDTSARETILSGALAQYPIIINLSLVNTKALQGDWYCPVFHVGLKR